MTTFSQEEKAAAVSLATFLTERDRYGSNSYLLGLVQTEIRAMAARFASELVAGNDQLATVVRAKTAEIVATALRDDAWLSETVTTAVAKALNQLNYERERSTRDD